MRNNRWKRAALPALAAALLVSGLMRSGVFGKNRIESTSGNITIIEETDIPEAPAQLLQGAKALPDLSQPISCILGRASAAMNEHYPIDESFLLWVAAAYGDAPLRTLAQAALDGNEDAEIWYEATGSSIHVLWLEYCRTLNYSSYLLTNVTWKDAGSAEETVIDFIGDINFDESWCTMEEAAQSGGIAECISEEIQKELASADITMINNEFAYSTRGTPILDKAYTFRANPRQVANLELFGADIVSLANNHVYDYGELALLDTVNTLKKAEIPYVGAGRNIKEAMLPQFFIVNGRKIAFVSATQIEKTTLYTREATERSAGVLRTTNPDRFLSEISQAKKVSDYVIVYVHWGTEGMLYPDADQKVLAAQYVKAGADLIIGNHAHRTQGAYYVENVPVFYSIGNFWFSDGALYTTIVQARISRDGALSVAMLPCIQQDRRTFLLTEQQDKRGFYEYIADISENVVFSADGDIFLQPTAEEGTYMYKSGSRYGTRSGAYDLLGRRIDIVGNLRNN